MTPAEVQHQLYEEIDKLSAAEQLRLLAAARGMKSDRPRGTKWSEIEHLVETIPDEDAKQMMEAIEEGCENIESDDR